MSWQDEFRTGLIKSGMDPRDDINKLQELQEKLERRHKIVHQMFEVLGGKCKGAMQSSKCAILMNKNVSLEKASNAFGA